MIAEMVQQESEVAEREHMLKMLSLSTSNLQETLMHLNEVVDVHSKRDEDLKRLNLQQEIEKMAAIVAPSLKQAGGTITLDILPTAEMEYNRAYLESVILNLLTNAIKYRSPERN